MLRVRFADCPALNSQPEIRFDRLVQEGQRRAGRLVDLQPLEELLRPVRDLAHIVDAVDRHVDRRVPAQLRIHPRLLAQVLQIRFASHLPRDHPIPRIANLLPVAARRFSGERRLALGPLARRFVLTIDARLPLSEKWAVRLRQTK